MNNYKVVSGDTSDNHTQFLFVFNFKLEYLGSFCIIK